MHNLPALVQAHGGLLVFALVFIEQLGLPIPAFPVLLIAGALSVEGTDSLAKFLFAATLGCLVSDVIWFYSGRRFGKRTIGLLCKISLSPDYCIAQTKDRFLRYGPKLLLVSKFVPGFNVIASPMAGALNVSTRRFLSFGMAGSLVWSSSGLMAGRVLGKRVDALLAALDNAGRVALWSALAAIVTFIVWKYLGRRRFRLQLSTARIDKAQLSALTATGRQHQLIDARSQGAIAMSPPMPGALMYSDPSFAAELSTVPRDHLLVVYCDCPNDISAAHTAKKLMKLGDRDVCAFEGGLDAFQGSQLRAR